MKKQISTAKIQKNCDTRKKYRNELLDIFANGEVLYIYSALSIPTGKRKYIFLFIYIKKYILLFFAKSGRASVYKDVHWYMYLSQWRKMYEEHLKPFRGE